MAKTAKKKTAKKKTAKKIAKKIEKKGENAGFTGKTHSDETKAKISKALKDKYASGHKPWNAGTGTKKKKTTKKVAKKTVRTRKTSRKTR